VSDLYHYRARLARVVDGDTYDLVFDLGFGARFKTRTRLLDVDTPEVRGPERPDGLLATQVVVDWFAAVRAFDPLDEWPLLIHSHDRRSLAPSDPRKGKYGRWLVKVEHAYPTDLITRSLTEEIRNHNLDENVPKEGA